MRLVAAILLVLAQAAWAQDEAGPPAKVAFLGITFLDGSLEGEMLGTDPAESARIGLLEELVETEFREHGYDLVPLDAVAEDREGVVNPAKCYGCDARMAAKLGADYALVGEVQKVSNLILSMNLQLRDAGSGETVKGRVVDFRSNTDETWLRAMRYILKHSFFPEE